MNTARQLLWVGTTREEKYKAKQAIDTFFVRGGDVLSAGVVYAGTHFLHLDVAQFAIANMVLTGVWLGLALLIVRPEVRRVHAPRRWAAAMAAVVVLVVAPSQSSGQTLGGEPSIESEMTRAAEWAARQADKAQHLGPRRPDALERRLEQVEG